MAGNLILSEHTFCSGTEGPPHVNQTLNCGISHNDKAFVYKRQISFLGDKDMVLDNQVPSSQSWGRPL